MPPKVLTYTRIHDTNIIISLWSSWSILSLLRTRSRASLYSSIIHIDERKPGVKAASLLMKYKTNIDRPVAAILTLNTVAHTVGAAGVGSESVKVFGKPILVLSPLFLHCLFLCCRKSYQRQ